MRDTSNNVAGEAITNLITPDQISAEIHGYTEQYLNSLKVFEYLRITDKTAIEVPVPVITINGETIATEGNIVTISGASKSGKSALTSILLAGAISRTGIINDPLELVEVCANPAGKAVLHFDTEQARHKHQYNLRTILKRAGMASCPEYFLSYNIRQLDLNEYQPVTSAICDAAAEKFGGVNLIVVDGLADYIADVNDQAQSNAIVKFFEEVAIQYRTPIITIVHTNPGSDKERGHLGSQVQRKSESVLIVKNDGDASYMEPKLLRMAGLGNVPVIEFRYDSDKGYHVGTGIRDKGGANRPADKLRELTTLANEVFALNAFKYAAAVEAIMKHTVKGTNAAKGAFTELKAQELITQGEDGLWRRKVV